jgi:hypothetical protein
MHGQTQIKCTRADTGIAGEVVVWGDVMP